MAQNTLKLVESTGLLAKPSPHPRPFETLYFTSPSSKDSEWAAKGRAATTRGALRAAVTRVLERRAEKAVVFNESGDVVARVWREKRNTISIVGSAVVKGVLE